MTALATLTEHRLSSPDFDHLARGFGDQSAVNTLSATQVSRRKLLILGLLDKMAASPGLGRATALGWHACELIDAADLASITSALSPAEEILLHPYLEVWAIDVLRLLAGADSTESVAPLVTARVSYLCAAAAAAALRAGLAFDVDLLVPAGGLAVPGLGRFVVRRRDQPFEARLRALEGELVLVAADGRSLDWEPVRRFADKVAIEDTDPYRETFGYPAEHRLSDEDLERWTESYSAARTLIRSRFPEYTGALDTGLRSITPLVAPADGHDASAAARQAYGAVGCMRPSTSAGLALLLLHEFQHVKLGALIDLVPLYDPLDDTLYYAPWRPDPRPLGPLLQGTYAHLAVTDFWLRLGHPRSNPGTPDQPDPAQQVDPAHAREQFGRWSTQTAHVVEVLAKAPGMNDLGRRFVAGMAETVAAWKEA